MPTTTDPLDHIAVDKIKDAIRDIPDFPKPGIMFKDITPILKDSLLLNQSIDYFYHQLKDKKVQYVVGIESRGFILGAALAYKLGVGFIPIRKKGKLPYSVERHEYDLEYGTDTVEIHTDALQAGDRVALVDDLLATGGTAAAATELLRKLNANVVSIMFLVELEFLHGRQRMPGGTFVQSMIKF